MQFVERPGQVGNLTAQWFGKFMYAHMTSIRTSTELLESKRACDRDATNRKYMGSDYKGCWDIWGDNHAALDQQSVDIGTFWANTKKTGFPIWMQTGAMGTKM